MAETSVARRTEAGVLCGRYEVLAELEGGALRARDRRGGAGGSEVELDVVDVADLPRAEQARILARLKKAARLRHPGVRAILGFGRDGGSIVVAGEPRLGAPLAGPLSVAEIRALARDVCAALAFAHAEGVVHGDLRIDGVRVVDGAYVITDLGAAIARVRGGGCDERTDVHALGRILYQASTGKPPFEVPPLELPSALRAPILRCLQRDPDRRYGSAAEVAAAISDAPVPQVERPRRGWIAPVALLLAVVAAAAGVYVWRTRGMARATVVAADAGADVIAPAPVVRRPVVAVVPFAAPDDAATGWLGRAASESLAAVLLAAGDVDVAPAAADARRAGVDAVVSGRVEAGTSGIVIDLTVLDVKSGALRFAERAIAASQDELLARLEELAERVRRGLDLRDPAPVKLRQVTTGDVAAFHAFVDGVVAEERGDVDAAALAYRDASARDRTFFHPRARLLELDGGVDGDRDALLAETRPLAARAGEWGALTIALVGASSPEAELAALQAIRARYPTDAARAAALARAFRRAGRFVECATAGEEAVGLGAPARGLEDVAWCALEAGDAGRAIAAASSLREANRRAGELLVAQVSLAIGKYADAREAFGRAEAAGAVVPRSWVRLAALWSRGWCGEGAVSGDDVAAQAHARVCGWAKAPAPRDELRLTRHPYLETPRRFEEALAAADRGEAETARTACEEVRAAAPAWPPAQYCLGRAAEAGNDWQGAFRAYRDFLDRWSDAELDNRIARDAKRRLARVIRAAREAAPR